MIKLKFLAPVVLALSAFSANAAVVQLGSYTHDYGSADGAAASTGSGSCDTLNLSSITVRDTNTGCARFVDMFDFGALNYSSIDNFKLTLNFSSTSQFLEDWRVRPADSAGHGSANLLDMNNTGSASISQSFVINSTSNSDVFNAMAANGRFYLWFAEQGLGSHNFALNSAVLEVNGTAVPEPSSIALMGLALLGFGAARRRTTR